MVNFQDLIEKTKKIRRKFPRRWDKKARFIVLVEEIGEIANALMVEEGNKPRKALHRGNDLVDALSDTLFDLILLAAEYGIDLEKEYLAMLERLEKRIAKGEFEF